MLSHSFWYNISFKKPTYEDERRSLSHIYVYINYAVLLIAKKFLFVKIIIFLHII